MQKLIKTLQKIQRKLARIILLVKWKVILLPRVSGRLKLQGNLRRLSIGRSFKCDGDLWIGIFSEEGVIKIHDHVSASGPLIITAINEIIVGSNALFGPNVLLCDHLHGNPKSKAFFETLPSSRVLYSQGKIVIQDAVQFGMNVVVLGGTKIEENVVIGANSVVKGNLQRNSIYSGAPVKRHE